MDDASMTEHLDRLVSLAPFFSRWTCESVDEWLSEHSTKSRVQLSVQTRHDYIYDKIYARAEIAQTPIPIKVRQYSSRMRWISIWNGDTEIAVWLKNLDPVSLLTSNYPTSTAVKRQSNGVLFGEHKVALFICGHTLGEDIAGADAWVENIYVTQEGRTAKAMRSVTLRRCIYSRAVGFLPLISGSGQMSILDPIGQPAAVEVQLPKVKVRLKRPPAAPVENVPPVVGIGQAKRESEEREKRQSKQKHESEGI